MAASLASHRQLSRGGAPEWCQSGAWDPKLLIARGCAQLQSTLQSSSSGSRAPARRVRGAARSRVRYSTGVKLRCQMVQNQGRGIEASVGTVPARVVRVPVLIEFTSHLQVLIEFTSHLQVLNVAFTPQLPYRYGTIGMVPIPYQYRTGCTD